MVLQLLVRDPNCRGILVDKRRKRFQMRLTRKISTLKKVWQRKMSASEKRTRQKQPSIASIMRMWFNASIVPTSGGVFFEPTNQSLCHPTSHLLPSTSLFAPHISSYISTSIHRHPATTHKSMIFTYVSTSVSIHHNVRSPPYTTNTYNADFHYSIVQKFRSTCL